ncbi:MAG: phosphatidate cytidylyltransferase [Deltaproteobacteria bacterium]|nr:phosphatidate cytidylyltransferase [Deltaproteobacteria bacterium]
MKNRIITGILFGSLWLLTIWTGSLHIFWLVAVIICAAGLYEFFNIALKGTARPYRLAAIFIGLLPVFAAQSGRQDLVQFFFVMALFGAALLTIAGYQNRDNEFLFLAKICAGLSFIGLTTAHLVLLMAEARGMNWLLLLTLIITASDTSAYFTGTALGRHKLCPKISPGKTLEGFVGGLAGAVVVTLLSGPLLFGNIDQYRLVILALVLSCLGVVGDLTESVFKRSWQVKDSGAILPGHGGILDRVDSILAAGPALYYIIAFRIIS